MKAGEKKINMEKRRSKEEYAKSLSMLVASALIFGSIGIFREFIPLPSAWIVFFRGAVGCLFLLAYMRMSGKRIRFSCSRKTLLLLCCSGILIGANWVCIFEAYIYTGVPVATLCCYLEPTIVIILATFVLHERFTLRKAVCVPVSLFGMVLVSGVFETGIPGGESLTGIFLALFAGFAYAVVVIVNKILRNVGAAEKTLVQLAAATATMVPYLCVIGGFPLSALTGSTLCLLLTMGVVHTAVAYLFHFGSLTYLKAQTVAFVSYLDPVTALILSAAVLNQRLTLLGLVGAVLVLGSALVCEMGKKPGFRNLKVRIPRGCLHRKRDRKSARCES